MRLTYVTVVPPSQTVLSLSEVKDHLRVDDSNNDTKIRQLISAATNYVEKWCNRKLLPTTVDYFLDYFPGYHGEGPGMSRRHTYDDWIQLPLGNLITLSFLAFTDTGLITTTWSPDSGNNNLLTPTSPSTIAAHIDRSSLLARIVLPFAQVWPSTILKTSNPIQIRFVTGYGLSTGIVTPAGAVLTWVSGTNFDATWTPGKTIVVDGINYTLKSVQSVTQLTLDSAVPAVSPIVNLSYSADEVPTDIKSAMLLLIGHWYENRESVTIGRLAVSDIMKQGVESLLYLNMIEWY